MFPLHILKRHAWPDFSNPEDYRSYGIKSVVIGEKEVIWYEILPEIAITTRVGNPTSVALLRRKILQETGCAYIEEAFCIEYLPKVLPQPIAEAILECLDAVKWHRYKAFGGNYMCALDWRSEEAMWREIITEFVSMCMENTSLLEKIQLYDPEYLAVLAADNLSADWEAATKKIANILLNDS